MRKYQIRGKSVTKSENEKVYFSKLLVAEGSYFQMWDDKFSFIILPFLSLAYVMLCYVWHIT
jgi:hypothetical protein